MHRTSARPAPLDFLLPPAHSTYGIDRRKVLGLQHALPQLTPVYFEAPIRDGLRTPPADDMGTAYQHPQYNSYPSRQDAAYAAAGASVNGYTASYSGVRGQAGQYSSLSQPPPASVSTLRNEIQLSQVPRTQPPSPQPSHRSNALAPPEGLPRRKTANSDMILPNLQIPPSINNSGGSLAEFAAQVCFGIQLPMGRF